ncbi:uncharacterized protein TNCV_3454901 [Trichonephila clavipes]|nr:uncharacterized protein TNCV_3454901 [Trichonephila clavipes]
MRVWKQCIDPNNSRNWKWTTEGDVNERRSTLAPHGGELQYSFLQAVGSTLVYCYRCTNVGFVNSSTSAAPWIACKGAFMQDPPHGKPGENLASGLASSCLFRGITLQFVGQ